MVCPSQLYICGNKVGQRTCSNQITWPDFSIRKQSQRGLYLQEGALAVKSSFSPLLETVPTLRFDCVSPGTRNY